MLWFDQLYLKGVGVIFATAFFFAALSAMPVSAAQFTTVYVETNLVSSGQIHAKFKDRKLINAWGLAFLPGSPIWISDNNSGFSTLYMPNGKKVNLNVKIPLPNGDPGNHGLSAPTGLAANSVPSDFGGNLFIFDSEDGTISAWNPADGSEAMLMVNNFSKGAVYKGLAIGSNASGQKLYVTNFNSGQVEVYDANFNPVQVPGGFIDNGIPPGFAPFGIANLNGDIYVTYALQNSAKNADVKGLGNGFVDKFDTDGNLMQRLISNGPLNSPWGLALTPPNFGPMSNTLIVGNFGDGMIHAFDPNSGAFLGHLLNSRSRPTQIDGLWSLVFGDGSTGATNTLFFSAGPKEESRGLFGTITVGQVKKKKRTGSGMGMGTGMGSMYSNIH